MTNRSGTLYTGVTRDVANRVREHRRAKDGFSARYRIDRLVYYESLETAYEAIAREKQIKGWDRKKKVDLVNSINPHWRDLSEGWQDDEGGSAEG